MADPAVILASVSLFLDIFDTCDRLYQGRKVTAAFGEDFENAIAELEMQWSRFSVCVKQRRILPDQIDRNNLNTGNAHMIKDYLRTMERYFAAAHQINKRYLGPDTSGALRDLPTPHSLSPAQHTDLAESETSVMTLVGSGDRKHLQVPKERHWNSKHKFTWRWKFWRRKNKGFGSGDASPHSFNDTSSSPGSILRDTSGRRSEDNASPVFEGQGLHGARKLKKILWVRHDKDRFWEFITQLREGNNNLESFLMQIEPSKQAHVLPVYGKAFALSPLVDRVQQLLGILHEDLMDINPDPELPGNRLDVEGYHLSVQLLENHNLARKGLADQPSVRKRLRQESFVFRIQTHTANPETESQLLMIESLGRPPEQAIVNLGGLELWGRVVTTEDGQDDHMVYHSNQSAWAKVSTLRALLSHAEYRERMQPVQIAQLARLLLYSHLYLGKVRETCPMPRPQNHSFYRPANQDSMWAQDSPLALRPWLTFGFGRRPDMNIQGIESGVDNEGGQVMSELGLLLFQIATGEPLDYGTGSRSFIEAKRKALQSLGLVDRRVSSGYTRIVTDLLNFECVPLHLRADEDDNKETEYVKAAVSALHKLDKDLEGTALAPLPGSSVAPAVNIEPAAEQHRVAQAEVSKEAGARAPGESESAKVIDSRTPIRRNWDTSGDAGGSQSSQGRENDSTQTGAGAEDGDQVG